MYQALKFLNFILGILFLIPPLISLLSFNLCIMGFGDSFDSWIWLRDFVSMSNLHGEWASCGNAHYGEFTSPAPIYLGLMAVAGAVLLHSAAEKDESDLKGTKK